MLWLTGVFLYLWRVLKIFLNPRLSLIVPLSLIQENLDSWMLIAFLINRSISDQSHQSRLKEHSQQDSENLKSEDVLQLINAGCLEWLFCPETITDLPLCTESDATISLATRNCWCLRCAPYHKWFALVGTQAYMRLHMHDMRWA